MSQWKNELCGCRFFLKLKLVQELVSYSSDISAVRVEPLSWIQDDLVHTHNHVADWNVTWDEHSKPRMCLKTRNIVVKLVHHRQFDVYQHNKLSERVVASLSSIVDKNQHIDKMHDIAWHCMISMTITVNWSTGLSPNRAALPALKGAACPGSVMHEEVHATGSHLSKLRKPNWEKGQTHQTRTKCLNGWHAKQILSFDTQPRTWSSSCFSPWRSR